jgi:ADP-heptose:LPS heptosyltransferase
MPPEPRSGPRILLASLDRLGDLLFTLPALELVRAHFPAAEIAFVTSRYAGGVLDGHPALDRLFCVERDGNSLTRFLHWRRFLRRWGPRPPDRLVLFREGHDGRALARRFRAARLDSVRNLPEAQRRGLHTAHLRTALAARVCDCAPPDTVMPTLAIPGPALRAARARLEAAQLDPAASVAMHPGVNRLVRRRGWLRRGEAPASPKLWPLERWVALGVALAERGLRPVLTGSGGEAAVCAEAARAIGPAAVSLAGSLPILELGGIYAQVRGLAVSDTGPGHLAAAVGGRLVSLFGPTSPFLHGPLAPEARRRILWRPQACGACRDGAGEHRCMRAIEVDEVVEALVAVGAAPAGPGQ